MEQNCVAVMLEISSVGRNSQRPRISDDAAHFVSEVAAAQEWDVRPAYKGLAEFVGAHAAEGAKIMDRPSPYVVRLALPAALAQELAHVPGISCVMDIAPPKLALQ